MITRRQGEKVVQAEKERCELALARSPGHERELRRAVSELEALGGGTVRGGAF